MTQERDIERVLTEQILDTVDEVFFSLDFERRFTYLNRKAEEHFRKASSDLLGIRLCDFVNGVADLVFLAEFCKALKERKPAKFEVYSAIQESWFDVAVYPFEAGFLVHLHDATERKEQSQTLQESEERLRLFIEHAPVALALFDTQMRYISASRRWLADYGLVGQDVIGRSHYDVFPEIEERWKKIHRRCLAGAVERAEEDRFERIDGRVQWLRWEVRPWHMANGSIGGIIMFTEDITERKQAEEELRLNREDLNRAQAVAKTGSWRLDVHQNELLWSDETYRIFGIPKGTPLTYDTFLATIYPEDREYVDTKWNAALRGEGYDIEHRIIAKGDVKWVNERAELEFDEQGILLGGFGTVQDITDRKRAEELLKKYQMLSENSRDIILFVRRDGRIIEANDAAVNTYGYTRDELLNLSIHDLRTPEAREAAAYQLATADSAGILFETVHQRRDGSTFHVEVSSRGADIGGQRILLSVIRDISYRKVVEQEQKDLLFREQHIAKMLQQALVPPSVPEEINGYRFAVTYRPALREAEIGGDFYDVFDLGDGRVCVMIGDIAGKGLHAAMRVAAARHAIRSYAFIETRPSHILTLANRSLCCNSDEERDMLTAFLAIIDTRLGGAVFSNAGHEPPVLLHSDGNIEELLTAGAPLGILDDITYSESTCRLEPGSRIVMVTDGITEARTSSVELFGKERVTNYIHDNSKIAIQDMVEGLLQAATTHAGGELQDDAAIVIVERIH